MIEKYGCKWKDGSDALEIEFSCIRKGGSWKNKAGVECGAGLFTHYRNAYQLLWPEDDNNRWSDLGLQRQVENDIVVFMGSSDSGKTYLASRFILTDWWCFPDETLWMVSSTELRGAELRIWGKIKELFNRGRERYPHLPGTVLESKHAITTESISDDGSEARVLTKGIIFIPCKQGGTWVGMGAYAGVKGPRNARLGHCGDETQAMERVFLDAYSNWYGKPNFRGMMLGNPYDLEDPLCIAGEPKEGWDTWQDTEKTQEWRSKFYNAWVVCFDGRDSPNLDEPGPIKYPYLIGEKKLKAVAESVGQDSWQYYNQCIGKPRPHSEVRRVITKSLCDKHRAFDEVIWAGTKITRIAGLDAAYGGVGGDRCVGGHVDFGQDVDGRNVIVVHPPVLVPVSVRNLEEPELQIARFMKKYCEGLDIPPQNFFFDGRSKLAVRIAEVWSALVNVVDFGGPPTDRPVSLDEFIWDGSRKTRRLKTCDEHYDRFVSELWFGVYYLVISEQLRKLPKDVASEGYQRTWDYTKGNRMSVETKEDMKKRTGRSPDLFDWLVTCIEGARRRGFQIHKLSTDDEENDGNQWLFKLRRRQQALTSRMSLNYQSR